MKKLVAIIGISILCFSLSACKNEQTTEKDEITTAIQSEVDIGASQSESDCRAIVLSTNSIEISVDDTYQLSYSVLPTSIKDVSVSWSSVDETTALIDSSGIITGIRKGQTNIVATCENGVYDICSVTVTEKSAYDSLKDKDKEFVDLFLNSIDDFYDPSSVELKYLYKSSTGTWDITVSAHNQLGGFSEKDYNMDSSGKITESILGHVKMPHWEDSCDLDLINAAIQEAK